MNLLFEFEFILKWFEFELILKWFEFELILKWFEFELILKWFEFEFIFKFCIIIIICWYNCCVFRLSSRVRNQRWSSSTTHFNQIESSLPRCRCIVHHQVRRNHHSRGTLALDYISPVKFDTLQRSLHCLAEAPRPHISRIINNSWCLSPQLLLILLLTIHSFD